MIIRHQTRAARPSTLHRRLYKIGALITLAAVLAACGSGGGAAGKTGAGASQSIKVGLALPLTGGDAAAGQEMASGEEYAVHEFNQSGGLNGTMVKLIKADTQGEPNQAATAAAKLINEDHVAAIVGGMDSTPSAAMLKIVQNSKPAPIVVEPGATSSELETDYGSEPWYYHITGWSYYREEAVASFLASITPAVRSVAVLYESGLYGTTEQGYAKTYLQKNGISIPVSESFTTGAASFSSELAKVKASKADVLLFIGYAADNVLVAKQEQQLGIRPKLTLIITSGETRAAYSDAGVSDANEDIWAPNENVPGIKAFVAGYQKYVHSTDPVPSVVPQAYTAMKVYLEALKQAGTSDTAKVETALNTMKFDTPYGANMSFVKSEHGAIHQLLTATSYITRQLTQNNGDIIVFPKDKATGTLIYPANGN